jgi:transcriptional regulator with XRE-family HTH domain
MAVYVKEWMKAAGYNQTRLARAMKTSDPSVSNLLRGRTHWTVDKLEKVAGLFGCEVVDLFRAPFEISVDAMLRDVSPEIKAEVVRYTDYQRQKYFSENGNLS